MTTKQDKKSELKQIVRRSIQVGSYIMWPLMIGFAVVAEPVVSLVFSDKWLPCVPYLQIACIQFALEPVQTANIQAVKALGKGRVMLVMEIIKKGFGLLTLVAVMWRGVMWIAWTGMLVTFFATLVNSTPNRKYLSYSHKEQLVDLLPSILLAMGMGICVYGVGFLPLPVFPRLVLQIITGVVVYLALSVLFKISAFSYSWEMVKKLLHRRKS
jgi:O-antigen/teichoic acid export membrane protein